MRFVILTEGGRKRGMGHIVRCGALAEAARTMVEEVCFRADTDQDVSFALPGCKVERMNWKVDPSANKIEEGDIVVVDSYEADADLLRNIRNRSSILAVLDDAVRMEYPADWIINGALGADRSLYPRAIPGQKYLLGPQYAMLRKEFNGTVHYDVRQNAESILVTVGNTDPCYRTLKIVTALKKEFPGMKITVIQGEGFPDRLVESLRSESGVEPKRNLSAGEMVQEMQNADIAVSAAGQTLYELAAIGVPTVVFSIADNQIPNFLAWRESGVVQPVDGDNIEETIVPAVKSMMSFERRETVSGRMRTLVDGKGAFRVVEAILNDCRVNG